MGRRSGPQRLLQHPTKCSCNNLQKYFATFCKNYLQKTTVQVINGNVLKVTLHNDEQLNIPAIAFGDRVPFKKIPKIVPVSGMVGVFNIEGHIETCPVHMMAKTDIALQPMCIDLGQVAYLCEMPGFMGVHIDPDYDIVAIAEVKKS